MPKFCVGLREDELLRRAILKGQAALVQSFTRAL